MSECEAQKLAQDKIIEVFQELVKHDGFASFEVKIKFLKRNQKEVVLHCGKQYRFVLDYPTAN